MLKALKCLWVVLCHIYRGWANPSIAQKMNSTRGWVAQGAGRAASSNSVTATSDKLVTISVRLLSFFLERLKKEGVVEEPGAQGGCWVTWH